MLANRCITTSLVCLLEATSLVRGQSIPIENAGFEALEFEDDEFLVGTEGGAPGWEGEVVELGTSWGTWNPPAIAHPQEAPRGDNMGWIYADPGFVSGPIGMRQTLQATVRTGATYTLTVAIGNPMEYFSDRYQEHFFFKGFPGYRIELLAGEVVVAFDENARAPADGTFERTSICFAAQDDSPLVGEPLTIRLVNLNDGPGLEVDFDDVQLTVSPVCWADVDGNGVIDADDFFAFLDLFVLGC